MEVMEHTEADKEAQHKLSENEPVDFDDALIDEGIDAPYLAQKAKEELEAHETKAQIPKGGQEFIYSKDLVAWDTRQKARQDLHKLRGDYPSEKVEHTVTLEDRLRAIQEKRDNATD